MIFVEANYLDEEHLDLCYEMSQIPDWEMVLCMGQAFLDDLDGESDAVDYLPYHNGCNHGIPVQIEKHSLFQTPILKAEHAGLALSGWSESEEIAMHLTVMENSDRVHLQVILHSPELKQEFMNDPESLTAYMDGLELDAQALFSTKQGILLTCRYIAAKSHNLDEMEASHALIECYAVGEHLGIDPYILDEARREAR